MVLQWKRKQFQIIFLILSLLSSSHSWYIPVTSRAKFSSDTFISKSLLWSSKTLVDPENTAASISTILTTTIAIIGTGAVGGYYGSRLWAAGYNVKFHLRGEHYHHCRIHGLNMTVSKATKHATAF
jgi:hypothetical protein